MNKGEFYIELPDEVGLAISALRGAGHDAYAVGGCVRDSLLGLVPKDWDITTDAAPEQIAEVFRDYRLLSHGQRFGTVAVLFGDMQVEITTYRVDGAYSDGRRPDSVAFTRALGEDLGRRDFTVNALAYRPDRGLIDLFGGRHDIAERVIRCVGDADARFGEDALRIMRALRFAAVLGFRIEPATARAIHTAKDRLAIIAKERICAELTGILRAPGAGAAAVFCEFADVLSRVLPELSAAARGGAWPRIIRAIALSPPEPLIRLALLFGGANIADAAGGTSSAAQKIAAGALRRLRFSAEIIDGVSPLVMYLHSDIAADAASVRRWLNRLGPAGLRDLLRARRVWAYSEATLLYGGGAVLSPDSEATLSSDGEAVLSPGDMAISPSSVAEPANKLMAMSASRPLDEFTAVGRIMYGVLARGDCYALKGLKIDGSGLIALGVKPGRALGRILASLLDLVIEGRCPNDPEALAARAKRLAAAESAGTDTVHP